MQGCSIGPLGKDANGCPIPRVLRIPEGELPKVRPLEWRSSMEMRKEEMMKERLRIESAAGSELTIGAEMRWIGAVRRWN